jgi:Mce-associated membrane protein
VITKTSEKYVSDERPSTERDDGDEAVLGRDEDGSATSPASLDTTSSEADETSSAHTEPTSDEVTKETQPQCYSVGTRIAQILAYAILPGLALALAVSAGYLRWWDSTVGDDSRAAAESVQAATDTTVAMLSYRPDTADQNLRAARDRMTGAFRDSYSSLTNDVVIPGAKQRQISAVATVPAAASVSAT